MDERAVHSPRYEVTRGTSDQQRVTSNWKRVTVSE
jgi:hypothetical protein